MGNFREERDGFENNAEDFDDPELCEQEEASLTEMEEDTPPSGTDSDALSDQLLRTLAEMENLRKRTEKEIRDARLYSVTAFARDLLQVADNLQRALASVPDSATEAGTTEFQNLLEGIRMTEQGFLSALEKHGIQRINALNEPFDPNIHQAMFEVERADLPEGTVVQVVQDGYRVHERVLRPAMVSVSKGGTPVLQDSPSEA